MRWRRAGPSSASTPWTPTWWSRLRRCSGDWARCASTTSTKEERSSTSTWTFLEQERALRHDRHLGTPNYNNSSNRFPPEPLVQLPEPADGFLQPIGDGQILEICLSR